MHVLESLHHRTLQYISQAAVLTTLARTHELSHFPSTSIPICIALNEPFSLYRDASPRPSMHLET